MSNYVLILLVGNKRSFRQVFRAFQDPDAPPLAFPEREVHIIISLCGYAIDDVG